MSAAAEAAGASAILTAALAYAARGIPVFPCNPAVERKDGGKAPLTPHGFKDASTDPATIRAWWTQYPDALIGVPTGVVSGFFVADLDVRPDAGVDGEVELAALVKTHGALPLTPHQETPSGGMHILFRMAAGRSIKSRAGKIGPGIDVRGDGGYICIAPSVRADGAAYRWEKSLFDTPLADAPQWLLDMIPEGASALAEGATGDVAPGFGGDMDTLAITSLENAPAAFQRVASALLAIDNSKLPYDDWIAVTHACAAAVDRDETFYSIVYEPWALTYSGNTPEVVRSKWDSIGSARVGWRWLADQARGAGWIDPDPCPEFADDDVSAPAISGELPVRFAPGEEFAAGQAAETRLRQHGVGLYRFGARLVEIDEEKRRGIRCDEVNITVLRRVSADALLSAYSEHVKFERWNGKDFKALACPKTIAEQYLARPKNWAFPTIAGVSDIPVLTPSGKILSTTNYDPETGLLYRPNGLAIDPIPEQPTKDDAARALATIEGELLADFPFTSPADRSVAIAYILTMVARRACGKAPLFAFSSPKAGSGKGKLVNIGSMIGDGRYAAGFDYSLGTVELTKQLDSALMKGLAAFHIDNVEEPLGGSRLCTLITEDAASARTLGRSEVGDYTSAMTFTANGNNLSVKRDMQRRAILCYIDPMVESPESRAFLFDPVQRAKERRGRYVAAALTIAVAYMRAGMPVSVRNGTESPLRFGSFESWAKLVCGALLWLDRANPLDTRGAVKADEPETDLLRRVLRTWDRTIGREAVTTKSLVATATTADDIFAELSATEDEESLSDALRAVAGNSRGAVDGAKLGYWIRSVKNQVADGMRLTEATMQHGKRRWQLQILSQHE